MTELILTKSSVLAHAWYDAVNRTLTLTFKSGKRYRYYDVSRQRFAAFAKSPSKGSYFSSSIKGIYVSRKLKPHSAK